MLVVLDLDDTLIKTSAVLKRALAHSCKDLGLTPEQFLRSYAKMREKGPFDLECFQDYLPPSLRNQWPRLKTRMIATLHRMANDRALYHDANALLRWLGRNKIPVCIYTHGVASIQQPKLKALKKTFPWLRTVITAEHTKEKDLMKCFRQGEQHKPWIWVDDSPFAAKTAQKFPQCQFFYLRRNTKQTKLSDVRTIRTLASVRRYLP